MDRVTVLSLLALEAMPLDPASLERGRRALLERPDDLEQAVQLEERLAGLAFELAPEPERLLGEAHVLLLGVGEAKDSRAPVARAAVVARAELLVDDDVVPAPLEGAGGGEAHHACADDGESLGHGPIVYPNWPRRGSAARRFRRPRARPRRRAATSVRRRAQI